MGSDLDGVTLWGLLEAAAADAPERPAVIAPDIDGYHITYASLLERAGTAAAGLQRLGVVPGDRVALWAANLHVWPIYFFAAVRVGAVVVPILPGASREMVEHVLRHSESSTLVMGPGKRGERIRLAVDIIPALRTADPKALWDPAFPKLSRVIMHTDETPPGAFPASTLAEHAEDEESEPSRGPLRAGLEALAALGGGGGAGGGGGSGSAGRAGGAGGATGAGAGDPDATLALLYTAGTTGGPPLGAAVSHRALVAAGAETAARLGLGPDDELLLAVPFAHYDGLTLGVAATMAARAAALPVFDPDAHRVLLDIADSAPTVLAVTPRLMGAVLRAPELAAAKHDTVRTIVLCANPAPAGVPEQTAAAFPQAAVVQAYGLAEAGGLVAMGRRDDPPEQRIGRLGALYPHVEGRVVDPDSGAEVGAGDIGELRLRGPVMAREYWRNRAATAAALDPEGWFRTGDLVTRDGSGTLRLVGRLTHRVATPAGPVDPREVESWLATIDPAVLEAWVVDVPDPAAPEGAPLLVAVLRLAPGARLAAAGVLARAAEVLPAHKRPARVFFVEAIPTGPTGAVLRHRLREQVAPLLSTP
ncbi:MAG TPA: class I adenylate-forming enzyme family protein [Myxococcota bacterium]|nr:class I adenylate-forming enzyme family protein [Myxococcota bacterium]